MIGMTLNRRNSQNIVRKRPGRSRGGRPTERWSAGLVERSALAGEGNVCLPPCATFCSPRLGQRSIAQWPKDYANTRWFSDALEFTCWNGEIVREPFPLDCHDREVIGWLANTFRNHDAIRRVFYGKLTRQSQFSPYRGGSLGSRSRSVGELRGRRSGGDHAHIQSSTHNGHEVGARGCNDPGACGTSNHSHQGIFG